MSPFTVQQLVRATHGALIGGDLGIPVSGVSIDSRNLGVGEAFFAICGHRLDGHAFIKEAAERGASCLVVHSLPDEMPPHVPVILVDETTRALGRLAAFHRGRFSVPVVAVTGSNGKTTTKEMIAAILAGFGPVLKPEGSLNNQWGLPLTLLKLREEHRALVVELGANQRGEISSLAEIARPTVGVVTTVALAHTQFFESLDDIQREKASLVHAIPSEGCVVLNADDPRVMAMSAWSRARMLTYSTEGPANVRAVGAVDETPDALVFMLEIGDARRPVHLSFAGRHNLSNALAAAAAGVAVGLPPTEIVRGLEAAHPAKGRCVWRRAGSVQILDDTYNANPASVRAALKTLGRARETHRLVVVLGDMLELGAISEEAHRGIGRAVAAAGVAEFIATGPQSRLAVEAAQEAGLAESYHVPIFEDVVIRLLKRLAPGDAVLVKGSRGMVMERVVDALVARLGGGG